MEKSKGKIKTETDIKKIAQSFGAIPKGVLPLLNKQYFTSKTQRGECKNNSCLNPRRNGSAFCEECSNKHKNGV